MQKKGARIKQNAIDANTVTKISKLEMERNIMRCVILEGSHLNVNTVAKPLFAAVL